MGNSPTLKYWPRWKEKALPRGWKKAENGHLERSILIERVGRDALIPKEGKTDGPVPGKRHRAPRAADR